MITRSCLQCGMEIKGRSDKKYCSDQCRSTHYNALNSGTSNYVRNVNNALRKNRRILEELNPSGKSRVWGAQLKARGFDFRYHTSSFKAKDGVIYYYCYEQGYLPIGKHSYLLVVKKDFQYESLVARGQKSSSNGRNEGNRAVYCAGIS